MEQMQLVYHSSAMFVGPFAKTCLDCCSRSRRISIARQCVSLQFHRGLAISYFRKTQEDHNEGSQGGKEDACYSNQDDTIDDASLVQSHGHEVHRYEFHIVYSLSYRVPVLYFHAYQMDGQLLVLDDIKKDLSTNAAKVLLESKWTFITQEEHPHLNRPWYCLHPCGTSEWLGLLVNAADSLQAKGKLALENYLVSWFSVVGQVFGLRIPLQMLTSPGASLPNNHSL